MYDSLERVTNFDAMESSITRIRLWDNLRNQHHFMVDRIFYDSPGIPDSLTGRLLRTVNFRIVSMQQICLPVWSFFFFLNTFHRSSGNLLARRKAIWIHQVSNWGKKREKSHCSCFPLFFFLFSISYLFPDKHARRLLLGSKIYSAPRLCKRPLSYSPSKPSSQINPCLHSIIIY